MDDGGYCWPAIRTLAKAIHMNERTVRNHLKDALKKGWIDRQQRGVNGKGWRRYVYQATVPNGAGTVPVPSNQGAGPHSQPAGTGAVRAGNKSHMVRAEPPTNLSGNYPENTTGTKEEGSKNGKQNKVSKEFIENHIHYSIPLKGGNEYAVSADEIDDWQERYPAVEVEQEIRKMIAWCEANATRRKTEDMIPRFINGWLNRTLDNSSRRKVPENNSSRPVYCEKHPGIALKAGTCPMCVL
jgi:hypothetical protein